MFGEFLNRPASFEAKEMAKAKRSSAAASMAQPADLQTLLDALPNMPLKDLRAVWAQKGRTAAALAISGAFAAYPGLATTGGGVW